MLPLYPLYPSHVSQILKWFYFLKASLIHFSFVPKNVNLPHFLPLLEKILVLPAYRNKFGCLPIRRLSSTEIYLDATENDVTYFLVLVKSYFSSN